MLPGWTGALELPTSKGQGDAAGITPGTERVGGIVSMLVGQIKANSDYRLQGGVRLGLDRKITDRKIRSKSRNGAIIDYEILTIIKGTGCGGCGYGV